MRRAILTLMIGGVVVWLWCINDTSPRPPIDDQVRCWSYDHGRGDWVWVC